MSSLLYKPLESVDASDLQALIDNQIGEGLYLEYKTEVFDKRDDKRGFSSSVAYLPLRMPRAETFSLALGPTTACPSIFPVWIPARRRRSCDVWPLAPAVWFVEKRGFDVRVVFDTYSPGVMPPLAKDPADYTVDRVPRPALVRALDAKPKEAEIVRRYGLIDNNVDLARVLELFTHIVMDLQRRARGNPFDNTNTIYQVIPHDERVNERVARYKADPGALEYVRAHYSPTGRIERPLALHTTYDLLVPVWAPAVYSCLPGTPIAVICLFRNLFAVPATAASCWLKSGNLFRGCANGETRASSPSPVC